MNGSNGSVAASRRGQLSAAAGRGYGVTVEAVCKRWSARMQMLGQEECNRVVESVQLRSQAYSCLTLSAFSLTASTQICGS